MPRILHTLIAAVALSLCFLSSASAAARDKKAVKPFSSFSVTPTVGAYLFSSSDQLDPAAIYGLKVNYDMVGSNIMDSLGIEGTVNYLRTKSQDDSQDASAVLVRADAIYTANPRDKYMVFFALGLGDLIVNRDSGSSHDLLINYGLGLKYHLQDYLSLRFDLRHLLPYGNIDTRNNFEFGTGLTYYFDKERRVTPPPKPKTDATKFTMKPVEPGALAGAPPPRALPPAELYAILDQLEATGPALVGITSVGSVFPSTVQAAPVPHPGTLALKPVPKREKARSKPAPPPAPVAPLPAAPAPAPVPLQPMAPPPVPAPLQPAAPPPVPVPAPLPAPAPLPPPAQAEPAQPLPQPEEPEQLPQGTLRKQVHQFTVEFDFAKHDIRPVYQAAIRKAALLVQGSLSPKVHIEGHTDSVGKDTPNLSLSMRRANSVKQALVSYGVDPRQITTSGFGFRLPAKANLTPEGRQRNRRAVTTITVIVTVPESRTPRGARPSSGTAPPNPGHQALSSARKQGSEQGGPQGLKKPAQPRAGQKPTTRSQQ